MIKSLKISQKLNQELKDIGIDMLPIHVDEEKEFICTTCGATKIEDCKCPEECESCSG